MTTVFITVEGIASRDLTDELLAHGLTVDGSTPYADLFVGSVHEDVEAIDIWFAELPYDPTTNATLVAYGRDEMLVSVVVDGDVVSTTTADSDGVEVEDYLEDAA